MGPISSYSLYLILRRGADAGTAVISHFGSDATDQEVNYLFQSIIRNNCITFYYSFRIFNLHLSERHNV